jgi:hypothetical protein
LLAHPLIEPGEAAFLRTDVKNTFLLRDFRIPRNEKESFDEGPAITDSTDRIQMHKPPVIDLLLGRSANVALVRGWDLHRFLFSLIAAST